jgi:Raf kinase inhibitor-like YbhB/YbcL family protein
MKLTSNAFSDGQRIPKDCSCEGKNSSPALSWTEVPEGVRSFALIVDDPDAPMGTFVHWVLYDLPANARALPAGVAQGASAPAGAKQGKNSYGRLGYDGPCPPSGPYHRYYFTLYALDGPLGLKAGAKKEEVERAMSGRVIASAVVRGRYKKAGLGRFVRSLLRR